MKMDSHLVRRITDYLTGDNHVRLKDRTSDTVSTVHSVVFHTSAVQHNSELCCIQKYSDDTVIVGCVMEVQDKECRSLVGDL